MDVWLLVAEESVLPGLVEAGRALGGRVRATVAGGRDLADRVAAEADEVHWFPTSPGLPAEAWAAEVAEHLAAAGARIVITGNGASSRLLLGYTAARLLAPVVGPVQEVRPTPDGVELTRLLYGGIALERDLVTGAVCVLLEGSARASTPRASASRVEEQDAAPLPLTCASERRRGQTGRDLGTAARVIGVGRGLRDPAYLDEIGRLADALGAEIACSRPVAEDLGWLPQDRYLGVSGRRIAPRLYLMLGIAGEVQHMIGVRDAEVIVAVNTDERAPVMTASDIAVVGDLRTVVPALIRRLELAERSERSA